MTTGAALMNEVCDDLLADAGLACNEDLRVGTGGGVDVGLQGADGRTGADQGHVGVVVRLHGTYFHGLELRCERTGPPATVLSVSSIPKIPGMRRDRKTSTLSYVCYRHKHAEARTLKQERVDTV